MASPFVVSLRKAVPSPVRTIVAVVLAAGLIGMADVGGWDRLPVGAEVPTTVTTDGATAPLSSPAFTAYVGTASPERLAGISSFLGQQISLGSDSLENRSWSEIFDDEKAWKSSGVRMIWAVPMLSGRPQFSVATGAAGGYDNYFNQLAESLVAAGMGNSILRLGWDYGQSRFPGNGAAQSIDFVGYWRQIVTSMRNVPGANFLFVWNPSRSDNGPNDHAVGDPTDYYPGDAYVDMIGIDVYDSAWKYYPGIGTEFQGILTQPYGLDWLAGFAAAHGKPVAIPEMGLGAGLSAPNSGPITGSGEVGGGDDPTFINDMFNWIAHHDVAYVAYWDFGTSSIQNGQNPLSAQALREDLTQFGSTTTAPPTEPSVPTANIYLGAWVNTASSGPPQSAAAAAAPPETEQIPAFNQTIGRSLSIYSLYSSFLRPPALSVLDAIAAQGAVPLVSWNCTDLASIASGVDDSAIIAYADDLKAYAQPVFLRWYWEMNLNTSFNQTCGGFNNPALFVAAWKQIWTVFQQQGVQNVAFVWNPSVHMDAAAYYPGSKYVDWIGADGYDRSHLGAAAFSKEFGAFYAEWQGQGKPMLVGETGATTVDQAQYIEGMEADLPTLYSGIKAVVYWDAVGSDANWVLQGSGLTAFRQMVQSPYFSFRQPAPA
jgi:beta-mannanase